MDLTQRLRFLQEYLQQPNIVGAIAPSSQALAAALCEPYRRATKPVVVLEVGAGTGAITRYLGSLLRPTDRVDICEINPEFATIIEENVLTGPAYTRAVAEDRVRLLRSAVQALDFEHRYDFVISGLPFTAFAYEEVKDIFEVIKRSLKPNGVFSYFEYVAMRQASRIFSVGRRRKRIRSVSTYLSRIIRDHQIASRMVLKNLPPAYARHLRFNGCRHVQDAAAI